MSIKRDIMEDSPNRTIDTVDSQGRPTQVTYTTQSIKDYKVIQTISYDAYDNTSVQNELTEV